MLCELAKIIEKRKHWATLQLTFQKKLLVLADLARIHGRMVDSIDAKFLESEIFFKKYGYADNCEYQFRFVEQALTGLGILRRLQ